MRRRPADAFTTELRVRYAETDQMGVVYHTHYLVWCEVARTALIRQTGRSYADLERDGLVLAVSEASVRYRASAKYDDRIRVAVWPSLVQSRAVTFEYSIERLHDDDNHDADGFTLASAATKLIALDPAGSVRALPGDVFDRLRAAVPASTSA